MPETLRAIDEQIVATYASRVNVGADQLREWMNRETWFTSAEAVTYGFADAVTEPLAIAAAYVPDGKYKNTPRHLLQSQRIVEPQPEASKARRNRAAARLAIRPKR